MKRYFTLPLAVLASYSIGLAAGQYSLIDLGTLGGTTSTARSVNDHGQVAGYSFTATDSVNSRAFLYSNGHMTNLGVALNGTDSRAVAINGLGEVAGFSTVGGNHHAVVWSNGVPYDLGLYNGLPTQVTGINDFGQLSISDVVPSQDKALFYSNNAMQLIGISRGVALDINSGGVVAGADENTHEAYIYANGVVTELGVIGQGIVINGGLLSQIKINSRNQVVGSFYASGSGTVHAFMYSAGVLYDLGGFNGMDINDYDQIVGTTIGGTQSHGIVFSHGLLTDLNTVLDSSGAGYVVTDAFSIANTGYIAANATAPNGFSHAVLLKPHVLKPPPVTGHLP